MNNLNQSPPPKKKKLRIFVHNNWSIQKNANTYKWLLQALIHSLMKTKLKNQSIQYTLNTVLYHFNFLFSLRIKSILGILAKVLNVCRTNKAYSLVRNE